MPDTVDERTRRLEQAMAKLEQRVDDNASDIRSLGPLVGDVAVLREQMGRVHQDLSSFGDQLRGIGTRMDAEAKERQTERAQRERRESEREDRERRDRFIRITTLVTLLFVFVSTTAAVIALVVH